ncbi:2-polyprenylphenol hydroxylase or related flavodoxin oxidoreductase [Methylacidiphilum infernorum V4]|uniref:2-polyprenylphenol hydroxylase or related flavodoxin oxidoreductase n=2 Tax=Candidatus Methylacidiphilum infernorum TaxID=511746 RepID=B3E0W6_METI4|nr:2-polyprenylphenol hydroxylase or related flavodoxin oxidoreductase [Methylacidiphilum infernorum V4]
MDNPMPIEPNPLFPRMFIIEEKRKESPTVVSLYLRSVDDQPFDFSPGQFNMISAIGGGEAAISIAGDPTDTHLLIHTLRIVGNVTRSLNTLQKKDPVFIRGPYGKGWPTEQAQGKTLILVAGGIGLPPLLPLIYKAKQQRGYFKKLVLLYGARTKEELLFMPFLEKMAQEKVIDLHLSLDRPSPGWNGHVGTVITLVSTVQFDPQQTVVFCCGPEIMMRFAAREFERWKVPKKNIFCSLERNMKCAIGICGHCQLSAYFLCKDGPVFPYEKIQKLLTIEEL